jgi:hypothetical protein
MDWDRLARTKGACIWVGKHWEQEFYCASWGTGILYGITGPYSLAGSHFVSLASDCFSQL